MKKHKIDVEYVQIDDLLPYTQNVKIHTQEQVEQIKKSIQEFGFNDPIGVWKNNEVIEGHGRLLAAKELGYETVPIIKLDKLSNEERKAYAIIHNQTTMNTGFDYEKLDIELEEIQINMGRFGFEEHSVTQEMIDNLISFEPEKKSKIVVCPHCLKEVDLNAINNL